MKKIIIIQLSRMGDLLMTLPLIRSLKEDYKDSHITVICYEEFSHLLDYFQDVDHTLKISLGQIQRFSEFGENNMISDKEQWPELYDNYDILINLAYDVWPAKLTSKLNSKVKYGRITSKKGEVRLLGKWTKYLFSIVQSRQYGIIGMADIFTLLPVCLTSSLIIATC